MKESLARTRERDRSGPWLAGNRAPKREEPPGRVLHGHFAIRQGFARVVNEIEPNDIQVLRVVEVCSRGGRQACKGEFISDVQNNTECRGLLRKEARGEKFAQQIFRMLR